MANTPILGPVFGIYGGQVNDGDQAWRIAMNNALLKLDATVSLSVINVNQTLVPTSPSAGDRYVVAPTGWIGYAGSAKKVAVYTFNANGSLGWQFYTPIDGLTAYEITTTYTWMYDLSTTSWISKPVASISYIIPDVGWMTGKYFQTSDNSVVTVDSMSNNTFSSVKYTIQIRFQTHYQVSELLLTTASGNAYITEYAKINSGIDLGSFDARVNSGNIELRFTPSQNSPMFLRIMKTQMFI